MIRPGFYGLFEFWVCGRQPGHYTRFGVTSGWAVMQPEPLNVLQQDSEPKKEIPAKVYSERASRLGWMRVRVCGGEDPFL